LGCIVKPSGQMSCLFRVYGELSHFVDWIDYPSVQVEAVYIWFISRSFVFADNKRLLGRNTLARLLLLSLNSVFKAWNWL
jgi:hypothetical protein